MIFLPVTFVSVSILHVHSFWLFFAANGIDTLCTISDVLDHHIQLQFISQMKGFTCLYWEQVYSCMGCVIYSY